MSRESVELVRAVYAAWAEGDFRAGTDLYDRHFLLVPGGADLTDAGRYLGPEGVKEYMLGVLSAWKDFSMAAEELIDVDNSVVVAVRQRGVGRESETPIEMRFFAVWTFRGPTAIRLELFRERNKALEAVGLRE